MVSASPDFWLKVWQLGAEGAELKKSQKRQSVNVGKVGVSPDGKYYMAEHGREMRIMSFATQGTEAILRNPSQSSNEFNTLAEFSPDGRLALTCSGAEGSLQLWKLDPERSYEVRQLSSNDHSQITCADISPDGSFIVAGNKDGKVFSWDLPPAAELFKDIKGVITNIDEMVDSPTEPKVHITVGNGQSEGPAAACRRHGDHRRSARKELKRPPPLCAGLRTPYRGIVVLRDETRDYPNPVCGLPTT